MKTSRFYQALNTALLVGATVFSNYGYAGDKQFDGNLRNALTELKVRNPSLLSFIRGKVTTKPLASNLRGLAGVLEGTATLTKSADGGYSLNGAGADGKPLDEVLARADENNNGVVTYLEFDKLRVQMTK